MAKKNNLLKFYFELKETFVYFAQMYAIIYLRKTKNTYRFSLISAAADLFDAKEFGTQALRQKKFNYRTP